MKQWKSGTLKLSPWRACAVQLQQTCTMSLAQPTSKVPLVLSEQTRWRARRAWLTTRPTCPLAPSKPAKVLLSNIFKDMKTWKENEFGHVTKDQPLFLMYKPTSLSHMASSSLLEGGLHGPSGAWDVDGNLWCHCANLKSLWGLH